MKSKPVIRNRFLLIADLLLIAAAIFGAMALRFEVGPLFFYYLPFAYWMLVISLIIKPIIFHFERNDFVNLI